MDSNIPLSNVISMKIDSHKKVSALTTFGLKVKAPFNRLTLFSTYIF